MFRKTWIGFLAIPAALLAQDADVDGWNEAAGVNLTVDEGFGARHSGMGITFAGFQNDANAVANAPAAMNDVDDFTFSTAHAEKFGEAKFDNLALLVPIESRSTLGVGFSRYGVSDIERWPEGVNPQAGHAPELFSVADYLVVAAFARRWGSLDAGAAFNFLYRQLDQDGLGVRADAMVQYTWDQNYRVGALVKGIIPSSASWQSGYSEYEPTDMHLAAAVRMPAPYFYGTLQAAYQSEGLFQKRAKSQGEDFGSRLFGDPGKILLAGNLGLEFLFDFGLAVRFGLTEMGFGNDFLSAGTFGIGYAWKKVLGLDYSFSPHPELLSSHRIALQFTPAFPKFNGRNFRSGGKEPVRALPPPSEGPQDEGLEEGEMIEPAPQAQPIRTAPAPAAQTAPAAPAPAPAAAVPAPAPAPAAPAAEQAKPAPVAPAAAPAAPEKPKPAPAPAKGAAEELLEEEEEGE